MTEKKSSTPKKPRASKATKPATQPTPQYFDSNNNNRIIRSAWYDTSDPTNPHVDVPDAELDKIGYQNGIEAIARNVVLQSMRMDATAAVFNKTAVTDLAYGPLWNKLQAERLASVAQCNNHNTLLRRMLAPMAAFNQ